MTTQRRDSFWRDVFKSALSSALAKALGTIMVAGVTAALAVIGLRSGLGSDADAQPRQTTLSTDNKATTISCPAKASSEAQRQLSQVRLFETAKSKVYICQDAGGGLWYHGNRKSDGATMTLAARQEGGQFIAVDNKSQVHATYRVDGARLTKEIPTGFELDEKVIKTQ